MICSSSLVSLVVGIGFLVPPTQSPLPLLRTWAKDAKPERMAAREQIVLDGMNQALAALGAPKLTSVGALYGEADIRELYTYPELDDYGPRADVKYLGNFQPGMGAAPVWPDTPGKRIFAYLDPDQSTPMLLKALAGTGQSAASIRSRIAQTGEGFAFFQQRRRLGCPALGKLPAQRATD